MKVLSSIVNFIPYIIKLAIFIVLAVCVLVFILSNQEAVTLSLYPLPFDFNIPLYIVGIVAFAIGLFVGGFTAYTRYLFKVGGYKKEAFIAKRQVKALENEVKAFRAQQKAANIPISPPAALIIQDGNDNKAV